MAVQIGERKSISKETARDLWGYYAIALHYGFDDSKAKGWACYAIERGTQGTRADIPHPTRFKHSKHARADTFDRLTAPYRSLNLVPEGFEPTALANGGLAVVADAWEEQGMPWRAVYCRQLLAAIGDDSHRNPAQYLYDAESETRAAILDSIEY